jgi:hypothetical protein
VAVDLADGWCRRWLPGLRRLEVERAMRLHIARKISICSVFADGETRTRTGDTTIFRQAGLTDRCGKSPATRPDRPDRGRNQRIPLFATVSPRCRPRRLRRGPRGLVADALSPVAALRQSVCGSHAVSADFAFGLQESAHRRGMSSRCLRLVDNALCRMLSSLRAHARRRRRDLGGRSGCSRWSLPLSRFPRPRSAQ